MKYRIAFAAAALGAVTVWAAGAEPIWGWRGDSTGVFPDATPVTEWGPATNVIWKTALPNWSNASPIIVGDRIFVCSEKDTLICLSRKDGAILWSKANDLKDVLTEEDWKTLQARRAERAQLAKEQADTTKKIEDLNRKVQFGTQAARDKNEEARRKQYAQQIADLLRQADDAAQKAEWNTQEARDKNEAARRREYEAQAQAAAARGEKVPPYKPLDYGPIPTEAQVAQFRKRAADLRANAAKLEQQGYQPMDYGPLPSAEEIVEMKQEVAVLTTAVSGLAKKLGAYQDCAAVSVEGTTGHSTMTPATDGVNVYVLFATGALVCYDLEGNRKWATNVGPSPDGYGQAASPVLVGDKLVVHVERVKAFDKATGKPAWQSDVVGPKYGTPVRAVLAGQDVILTASGAAVRASDGHVVAKGLGNLTYSAPIVQNGVAYYMDAKTLATQLPLSESDTAPTKLWSGAIANERYYASSVAVKGVVYAINQVSVATAVSAADGKTLWEKKLDLGRGTVYPSIAAAGDYVFISNDNGQTLVIKAGPTFESVRTNTLEPFRSSPVFEGGRMYIRTLKNLYCIGAKEAN